VFPLVVFDLDGTLIDSERDLADAVNALLAERGAASLSERVVGGMVGDGAAVLVRRAFDAAGLAVDDAALSRFLQLYDERLTRTTRPYDGIIDALTSLRSLGATAAVLTNKPSNHTTRLLDELGLATFFSTSIGGDGPFARKPDPAGLLHLVRVHDSHAGATVMVGDSHIDAATAAAAGTGFCLAEYGFGARTIRPEQLRASDVRIATPADLPRALSRLLR
jgi:phosphoglycolate phosphatase